MGERTAILTGREGQINALGNLGTVQKDSSHMWENGLGRLQVIRLQRPCYLNSIDHGRKIRSRKHGHILENIPL
jgi:hypothetical protein